MNDDARLHAVMDKFEIIEVSNTLLCSRDAPDWDRLAQCFHPDARVTTSWFDGTAAEFAMQSKKMMDGHHPNDTQRHAVNNCVVRIKGNRAINEYYLILYQGRTMDGYEFDFTTWSVTLEFFEKRNGLWRVCKRGNIYEKDRMEPHVPGSVPQSYFEQLDLSRYPKAVRYHCYRNERASGETPKNLIVKGSPEEKAFRNDAEEWLAAGA